MYHSVSDEKAETTIRGLLLRTSLNKYQCTRCFKTYKHAHIMRRHMEFECGMEPKFQCSICGHKSKRKYEMTVHIRKKHMA
ncbi:hypothetical protein JTB14_033834 [Gonioctena quinquepunctata]|nr:hypothetical protein JTB14_033834 [Gonioctena quinquepunctata]